MTVHSGKSRMSLQIRSFIFRNNTGTNGKAIVHLFYQRHKLSHYRSPYSSSSFCKSNESIMHRHFWWEKRCSRLIKREFVQQNNINVASALSFFTSQIPVLRKPAEHNNHSARCTTGEVFFNARRRQVVYLAYLLKFALLMSNLARSHSRLIWRRPEEETLPPKMNKTPWSQILFTAHVDSSPSDYLLICMYLCR